MRSFGIALAIVIACSFAIQAQTPVRGKVLAGAPLPDFAWGKAKKDFGLGFGLVDPLFAKPDSLRFEKRSVFGISADLVLDFEGGKLVRAAYYAIGADYAAIRAAMVAALGEPAAAGGGLSWKSPTTCYVLTKKELTFIGQTILTLTPYAPLAGLLNPPRLFLPPIVTPRPKAAPGLPAIVPPSKPISPPARQAVQLLPPPTKGLIPTADGQEFAFTFQRAAERETSLILYGTDGRGGPVAIEVQRSYTKAWAGTPGTKGTPDRVHYAEWIYTGQGPTGMIRQGTTHMDSGTPGTPAIPGTPEMTLYFFSLQFADGTKPPAPAFSSKVPIFVPCRIDWTPGTVFIVQAGYALGTATSAGDRIACITGKVALKRK